MSPLFSPTDLSRALVVKLRHHGDVLLATPVLSALKRAAPQCEIDALAYADTLPMIEGHPAVSRCFGIDRQWKTLGVAARAAAEWRLLSALRERRYDLVVHLTEQGRGAWLARLLRPRWSVAPRHGGDFWRGSFTHLYPKPDNARRHTVERNLDALRRLGIDIADADKAVCLVPGTAAEAAVAALLTKHGLAGDFVHVHATSRWMFKCWPAQRVAELIDALAERGLRAVLSAAPAPREMDMVAAIKAAARSAPVDLAGRLSLKEAGALTARARLFVGVDSAPMHIAAAMGTPVVALFGPSGEFEWGPWRTTARVVVSDRHPCRPCGIDGCGGSKRSDCLTELPVSRVLAACDELLAL